MNNKQESVLSMFNVATNYLVLSIDYTSLLPGYSALFELFKEKTEEIMALRERQEINKSGIRDRKQFLRADLAAKAYDICRKTEVYATLSENSILAKEVHFSETALSNTTDLKLESRALIIFEKANDNIANLAEYDVVAADLTALKVAIDLFHIAIPTPRTGTTDKKRITDLIVQLFKEANAILEKMDLLVEIIRLKQPVFYSGYKDNRKIIARGITTLALTAFAMDAITGEGQKGVKFTFVFQAGTGIGSGQKVVEPFVKITASKGKFNVKSMTDGSYVVTIEKTGYKKQVITVNKAAGDRVKLEVKLEKI